MNEKKNTYVEEYTHHELLVNLLNGKRQELSISLVDIRFLELLFEADKERKVSDDEGRMIPVQRRIDELKVGVTNIKVRMQAVVELLDLSKKEGELEKRFSEEALMPSAQILPPEALKDVQPKEGEEKK